MDELAATTDKSPFKGVDVKSLTMTNGRVHAVGKSPESGAPFQELLALRRLAALDGQAKTERDAEANKYSTHSFGAHFLEASWDPGIARLRVTRL